jgi:tetratricopeptide (TPR) repeat protein
MRYLIILAFLSSGLLTAGQPDPYKKAASLIAEKKYGEAFSALNELMGKNSKDLRAYDLMGLMYKNIGGDENLRIAESYYYKILKVIPDDLNAKMDLATCSYRLGHTEKAKMIFEEIYKKDPQMKKLNYYLGSIAFFENNELDRARNYLRKELGLNSKDTDALFVLGLSYEYDSKGERRAYSSGVDEAIKYYKQCLKISPENPSALFNLAIAYSVKKDQDNAVQTAEKLLKVKEAKSLYMATYYNLACFYALKKEPKKAMDNLKKAIENGFEDFEHMQKDSDLVNIKDDKEFKTLIDRYVPKRITLD